MMREQRTMLKADCRQYFAFARRWLGIVARLASRRGNLTDIG